MVVNCLKNSSKKYNIYKKISDSTKFSWRFLEQSNGRFTEFRKMYQECSWGIFLKYCIIKFQGLFCENFPEISWKNTQPHYSRSMLEGCQKLLLITWRQYIRNCYHNFNHNEVLNITVFLLNFLGAFLIKYFFANIKWTLRKISFCDKRIFLHANRISSSISG